MSKVTREEQLGEAVPMGVKTTTFDELERRVRNRLAERLGVAPNLVGVDWVSIVIQIIMSVLQNCGMQRGYGEIRQMIVEKPVFVRVAFWLKAGQMDLKSMGIKSADVVECCVTVAGNASEKEMESLMAETLDLRI